MNVNSKSKKLKVQEERLIDVLKKNFNLKKHIGPNT
jgi:hypothetical protein